MVQLSKSLLSGKPESALQSLPEKVLQFGTGVLLRGLPDYLIDQANRQGIFNGRVVVVKSTDSGDGAAFGEQDHLYTLCIRGVEEGRAVSENVISSAISRVLTASREWQEVLACAADPQIGIVISNTTEVGIQLVREDIHQSPPASFPGKLLAFLYERYRTFRGDQDKGVVIIPTELIPQNGALLESIVLELAHLNDLEFDFLNWLESACRFCNSLVDRIVPGRPSEQQRAVLQEELGYTDKLLTVAEPYCFWAIEGDEKVSSALSFRQASPESVVVAPDIERYYERKLRLLNGTHTLSCGLAHLAGFVTVHEAMENPDMEDYIERLILAEIAQSIPCKLPEGEAAQFGRQVMDRFRNPSVEHRWLSIAVQFSTKMRMRNIPVLQEHYRTQKSVPVYFALGFAAFLCFYRNAEHKLQDDNADYFTKKWAQYNPDELVDHILSDKAFWGADLSAFPGFSAQVKQFVKEITGKGARQVIKELASKNEAKNLANTSA
ncbi:MAG: tagaturonate reductase [Lewinellaceae bacterium]|nr:tagaturonate reductase [Lewinellaceae bacterium]